jgi:hypothetical protein
MGFERQKYGTKGRLGGVELRHLAAVRVEIVFQIGNAIFMSARRLHSR